jgi:FkbM family methyltransferase
MILNKVKIFEKYTFYYLPDDKYVGQRVALEKYEPYETKLILKQVKKGDVIVDVGANIGYYTMLLAQKAKKVYAFEPDSVNFEILGKNIKANNLKNVVAIKAAVGSKEGKLELYKSKENFGDHKLFKTLIPAGTSIDREAIKVIKLDDFIKEKVDLIKIDTQGWEPEVIDGSKKIIEKDKPIIFMEYSPASYKLAKLDGNKMMEFCKAEYGKFFWIDEWLYIYKVLDKTRIDQICSTNKTGYADLWMKKEVNFKDIIEGFRDFKIKKWVKKIIFRI